jgi:SAM-dependent methyltransferase
MNSLRCRACYTYQPMIGQDRFKGTLDYLYAHWPSYFLAYGGLMLSLALIGISLERGWLGFASLGLASFILIGYFLSASIWAAHQLHDRGGLQPHHVLFDMGQVQATDRFVCIHLGLRRQALELGRRLTTGEIVMVDVYSPQWAPSQALNRWRTRMPATFVDPRYQWYSGDIGLLPLPDRSVQVVILCQVLSELWQQGDQLRLLQEVQRILVPNGRILVGERANSQANWLIMGPAALSLPAAAEWRALFTQAGFQGRQVQELQGIIHCFRADKPTATEATQLAFELAVS